MACPVPAFGRVDNTFLVDLTGLKDEVASQASTVAEAMTESTGVRDTATAGPCTKVRVGRVFTALCPPTSVDPGWWSAERAA